MNNLPVATNDAYAVDEDGSLNVSSPGVLGNDTDDDGDPLIAVLMSSPNNGQLTLNHPVDAKLYIPHSPTWSMFASQAAAIVLYDRLVKRGSFG